MKTLIALVYVVILCGCGMPNEVTLDVQEIDINAPTCTVKQEGPCAVIMCPDGSNATICGVSE